MPWLLMSKKMSQRVWRYGHMRRASKLRVPATIVDVEVRKEWGVSARRDAAGARVIIKLAQELGLMPENPPSGSTYRLPLCQTLGCLVCKARHLEGQCPKGGK